MAFLTCTDGARPAHSRSSAHRGELEYQAPVAPGVIVTWDPAVPDHCVELVIPDHLAGIDRGPWLRLAAVMTLDRKLYLPLRRSLLDAELAAAQFAAARTLTAAEPIREFLIGRALVAARRASPGVVAYLDGERPPVAFEVIARCYASLSGEVREYDTALDAVTEAWHRLSSIERPVTRGARIVVPPSWDEPPAGVDSIDPRWLPARVVRLGPSTDAAEISVGPAGEGELRVRVAAFADDPLRDEPADLGVRLIDRRSGQVRGYGQLGQPRRSPPSSERYFEGIVALPDAVSAPDVRIDLYELSEAEPPVCGDDTDLRRVRRATLFLASWRALVADVRLWGTKAAPADRLHTFVRENTDDGPLWSGGPSRSDLCGLAALGNRTLSAVLRGKQAVTVPGDDGGAAAVIAAVSGPGDLLVAEVAAAYERGR